MRRQSQLRQGRVFRGFIDAAFQTVFGFHGAEFGGHQTQDHQFVFGQVAQRAEVAAAVVVIFQEVRVYVHLRQQRFSHRFIVASSSVRAFEIAATQVHGQCHASWFLRHHFVDEGRVAVRQFIRVVTACACGFAHFVVAQIGQVGVVHLHISATCGGQRAQFIAVGFGHIVVKRRVEFGVSVFADTGAAAAKVQHGG